MPCPHEKRTDMEASSIDLATYAELRDAVGDEFATELVDTFLEEAPVMLADLRSALAEADADGYRRAAHSLKSNSLTFGAMALGDLARAVELGGFAADPAADAVTLDELETAYAAAAAALRDLCSG